MNTFTSTQVMPEIYCPMQLTQILGHPTDQYYRKHPRKKTKLPVLLLHGDMDSALPVPIARHFFKQYSLINSNLTYIEMPRTEHNNYINITLSRLYFHNRILCSRFSLCQCIFVFI
ncbi:unnamed protein product [Rotaria sp. Silwood1]|nr:unnamed protein product [Rotaria sp. Silwood1]CAF1678207.1 unnamed protein product [Rotaria sp. Silwood1]